MATWATESRTVVANAVERIRAMTEDDRTDDADGVEGELAKALRKHETCTRYAVIDPILWALGWETWNLQEVRVEYEPKQTPGKRVDYALFDGNGTLVVLIEAKRWGKPLDDKRSIRQLGKYARGMNNGVACLTDGWEWVIYDLSLPGAFTRKRKASADIWAGEGTRAASTLNRWLRRSRWE